MSTKKSSGSYYQEAVGRLEDLTLEKGCRGEIAAAYRDYMCGGYLLRQPSYARLVDVLLKSKPASLSDIYEWGGRSFVEGVTDEGVADRVGKCVARLPLYPYAPSPYRRSFRSSSLRVYLHHFVQLMGCIFFPGDFFDLNGQIFRRTAKRKTKGWDYRDLPEEVGGLGEFLVENLVALALDEGDESVLEGIRGACLDDKEMDAALLCGMLKSARQDMYDLLRERMGEEGWCQKILTVGDYGCLEAQIQLMTYILDEGLLGNELVRKRVSVWMGLGYSADRSMLENLVHLALSYERDAVVRRGLGGDEDRQGEDQSEKDQCQGTPDSQEAVCLFARLWAVSLYDVKDVMPILRGLIKNGHKTQQITALSFATQLDHKSVQMDLACCGLEAMMGMDEKDLDRACLSMANFDIAYMAPMGTREGLQSISRSVEGLRRTETRDRYFKVLVSLLGYVPAEGHRVTSGFFRGILSRENVCANLFLIAAWDFDVRNTEILMRLVVECEVEIRRKFISLFIGVPRTLKERGFLFACLNDKSMPVRLLATARLEEMMRMDGKGSRDGQGELTAAERAAVMNLLTLKSVDIRTAGLSILLCQTPEAALGCAQELCGDKRESKRAAGLEILLQLVVRGYAGNGRQPQCVMGTAESVVRGDRPKEDRGEVAQDVEISVRKAIEIVPLEERSTREQMIIRRLQNQNRNENSLEKGLGLFDPLYRLDLKDKIMGFASEQETGATAPAFGGLSGVKRKRMTSLLEAMCAKVESYKDFTFIRVNYDLTEEETRLGSLTYLVRPHDTALKRNGRYTLDDFVLPEIWRAWRKENRVTLVEILVMSLIYRMSQGSESKHPPEVDRFLGKVLPMGIRECAKEFSERAYGLLSMAIIEKFIYEFAPEDIFVVLLDVMVGLLRTLPAHMWGQKILVSEGSGGEGHEEAYLTDIKEIEFVLDLMESCVLSIEQETEIKQEDYLGREDLIKNTSEDFFLKYAALCIHLGQLSDRPCVRLTVRQMTKAVVRGLAKPDLLYQYLCLKGLREAQEVWRSQKPWEAQNSQDWDRSCEYSLLIQMIGALSARVIDIELGRGDSETSVSRLAMDIIYHEGVHAFVGILAALAGEMLDNSDTCPTQLTKSVVLSSLLRASSPGPEDSAESLRQVLRAESKADTDTEADPVTFIGVTFGEGGTITEQRLLEAAMYVPAWAPIIAEYLAWPGFLRAVEFLRIHVMEDLSDQELVGRVTSDSTAIDGHKSCMGARVTVLSAQEISEGVFDINWLRGVCQNVGEERFLKLLDAAKCNADTGRHSRLRLFVEASLNHMPLEGLYQDIAEKRQKDKLICLSLVPLQKEAMADALRRFEFIQEFFKQSQSLSPKRCAREKKACAIALRNLAANAKFSDVSRFIWHMEYLKELYA